MKKKILFRIRSLEMGGVGKVMFDIIKHLDKDKYEPFILLNLRQGALLKDIPPGIKVFSVAKGREKMSKIKSVRFIQLAGRALKLRLYSRFPKLLMRKVNIIPDMEIAMMHSSLPDLVRSPFKFSRKLNWFHSDIRSAPLSYGEKIAYMMNQCYMTVFVSHTTEANFNRYVGVKITNSTCIYNAFNTKEIHRKSQAPIPTEESFLFRRKHVFVSVGRLSHLKGYDVLLEAHAELIKEGVEHTIVIIGGGEDEQKLKNRVKHIGAEDTFHFLGAKENPYPYIALAEYYIQPSRSEAYPLAPGEAMILNKPVICTDVGGVNELVSHGITGYVIKPTREALKSAIKEFISNTELVYIIRQGQKEYDFERHNLEIYTQIDLLFQTL